MSEHITLSAADGQFAAYVARPCARHAPAVIVLQEIFGVNADIRGMCDELAEHGFIAIAPDLFWRTKPGLDLNSWSEAEWSEALAVYKSYNLDEGVSDVSTAIEAGRVIDGSIGKVGVMGFCLGGLMTFLTAARSEVDAAVEYYGGETENHLSEASAVKAPMLIHLAEEDEYISKEAQGKIRAAFANSANVRIHTYAGCNHAFARHTGAHYDAAAARLANERTLAFLSKKLR
ncbi:dienelactone hydrolase family protein [Bradyrhizobium barranii subsp. apii]|uniref:dienelactone hydrolase family protein n=1 Tax=Bradyrhizobium barranii TaxID=2992140 RepID=UPI001AA0CDE6|nr:dienelactone hydrolase family protein [Bradyrhizobium barranii]UPT95347.1 dienelactone hydrolase family protein [Bradyrhizobium barranii subsp. apii]